MTQRLFPLLSASCMMMFSAEAYAEDDDPTLSLGAGAAVVPTYEGAKKVKAIPLPDVDGRYGRFFINTFEGAGVDLYRDDIFRIGASLTYVRGYDRSDVPDRLRKIDDTAGARVFGDIRLNHVTFSLDAVQSIGGTKGLTADAGVSYYLRASRRLAIIPSVSTTWADGRYMRRYFGVSADEAAASGLDRFRAGSGFKDVTARVTASYALTNRITLTGNVGAYRLTGDAVDSPINQRKWGASGFAGLSYRFF